VAVNYLKDLIVKFFWNENDRCRFKLAHIRSYLSGRRHSCGRFSWRRLPPPGWPLPPRLAFTRLRLHQLAKGPKQSILAPTLLTTATTTAIVIIIATAGGATVIGTAAGSETHSS
jgi:hypothetical protein